MKRASALDVVIVAALGAWALAEALLLDGDGARPVRVAWALAYVVPLLWRRQAPVPVAFAISAVVLARILVDQGGVGEEGAMPFPVLLTASFAAAVHATTLRLAVASGLATYVPLACAVGFSYFEGSGEPADAVILTFFAGAAWGAGYFVRRRGESAVVEERARIARELHDIIGHSMSVISLQAGAAEQVLHRDPDRAATHLRAVRQTAHEALVEMRRLMGVLREDEAQYAPQPGLEHVDALVRDAGLAVEVRVEGSRGAVPPGVDLAAYRIVQEALTNARKHAGAASARVTIRYEPERVEVVVANARGSRPPMNGDGGGQGLAGMRERVRVFGGSLDAGPDEAGGFVVAARLPL